MKTEFELLMKGPCCCVERNVSGCNNDIVPSYCMVCMLFGIERGRCRGGGEPRGRADNIVSLCWNKNDVAIKVADTRA